MITVPAYFNNAQREATLEAAKLAGMPCDRLLNEPTAAALAYGHNKDLEQTIVVFDLGGGTFDCCVLQLASGVYEVLATRGDSHLGGEDFDIRLLDYVADAFQESSGADPREDVAALQRLKDAAERAKCELSQVEQTTLSIPQLLNGQDCDLVITRSARGAVGRRTNTDAEVARGDQRPLWPAPQSVGSS